MINTFVLLCCASPGFAILVAGSDAFAVAIHDAIVDYGVLHREVGMT